MLGIGNLLLRISRTERDLQTILQRRSLSLSCILLFHNIFQYSSCIGPSEVLLCCIFNIYADFTVNSLDGLSPRHKVSRFEEARMWILRILIADRVSNKSKIFSLSHCLESWWMSSTTSKLFGATPVLSFKIWFFRDPRVIPYVNTSSISHFIAHAFLNKLVTTK